uniref:carbonic anhydrase family protein n=1 Tax=unclassified Variovorax TaxID=663243 RepID=UPI000D3C29B0
MNSLCECGADHRPAQTDRRGWLKKAGAGGGAAVLMATLGLRAGDADAAALGQAERDAMTPDQVIASLKKGNERFRAGRTQKRDHLAQKRASAAGQYPAAVILSCIDSRAPVEIILDAGIGDTFNARIAGNVSTRELLGSMEFACAAAGAKLVLVMGHTACGAIKGAIDNVELGNLTGLLEVIKPAVAATTYAGERTSKNDEFVDAVATTNVRTTIEAIRSGSPVLANLEKEGKIKIVGSMYSVSNGRVTFLS